MYLDLRVEMLEDQVSAMADTLREMKLRLEDIEDRLGKTFDNQARDYDSYGEMMKVVDAAKYEDDLKLARKAFYDELDAYDDYYGLDRRSRSSESSNTDLFIDKTAEDSKYDAEHKAYHNGPIEGYRR